MPAERPMGLFTDLYELTMAQAYLEHGMTGQAVFDLHVRDLPPSRGFMVAAGLQVLLEQLEGFRFTEADLAYLAEQPHLSDELIAYLSDLSFEGTIRAVPEGELVFPYEPILQLEAPLPVAQLVETLVLNTVHVSTLLATKAARCFEAVGGPAGGEHADLVDFGARRAHGHEAARMAARSAWIAGFAGTSLVEAGRELGIPIFGTMAHSFVQAFDEEEEALSRFAETFPGTTLLIDTYDTVEGARTAIAIADRLAEAGRGPGAVRLDSGDLGALAKQVRGMLDEAGHEAIDIIASGGLDEHKLSELEAQSAPIDGYGVGTSLVVSSDAPSLNISYKLCAYEGQPVMKTSPEKHTLPGRKQVWRAQEGGQLAGDTITLEDEEGPGAPLLEPAERLAPAEAARQARERFLASYPRLPAEHRALERPQAYPVARSPGIEAAIEAALERVGAKGRGST